MKETQENSDPLKEIRALFRSQPNVHGSIASPTKHGFIAIAQAGKTVWNTWREKYPLESPDFSGITFEEDARFSGFVFSMPGHECKVNFSGARFLKKANFSHAKFGNETNFSTAIFNQGCDFSNCLFGDDADFTRSLFIETAKFMQASFGNGTLFDHAEFRSFCHFTACRFGHMTSFFRTKFKSISIFSGSEFGATCNFRGATFSAPADFRYTRYIGDCDFSSENKENTPSSEKYLYNIDFGGSVFHGAVEFTSREFRSRSNFGAAEFPGDRKIAWDMLSINPRGRTLFLAPPVFHQSKLHQDTSFDDAEFKVVPGFEAARAFRTLKLAMEQLKATREEQKFFRLEMKAEHPGLPLGKRWASTLYNLFSDYGFSLWRPLAWLIAFSFIFGIGYGILADACAAESQCAQTAWAANTGSTEDRTSAVIKYTLASVSPVPGLDKMQTELRAPLFGHHGWIPITALVLEIFHKITSLIMVFLFALALRNLFKMKS